jgi:hypothetical protein
VCGGSTIEATRNEDGHPGSSHGLASGIGRRPTLTEGERRFGKERERGAADACQGSHGKKTSRLWWRMAGLARDL